MKVTFKFIKRTAIVDNKTYYNIIITKKTKFGVKFLTYIMKPNWDGYYKWQN